jgi:hypothetical protein
MASKREPDVKELVDPVTGEQFVPAGMPFPSLFTTSYSKI